MPIFKWNVNMEIDRNDFYDMFNDYFENITKEYIEYLLRDKNNHILFYCIDNVFTKSNIVSLLIYHKIYVKKNDKCYILLLATQQNFRNMGYGKVFLDEFIEFMKKKKDITIYLKATEKSKNFYISYGFIEENIKGKKLF